MRPRPPAAAPQTAPAPRWALPAVLAALLILFAANIRTYFVGYFNDDAFYLIGARSLLDGSYVQLHIPGAPPITQYVPGYPALLALILAAFGENAFVLKAFSIAMLWTALLLLAGLWRGALTPRVRLAALALAGLSPLTLSLSSAVIAEIPYLLLAAGTLLLASRRWQSPRWSLWAGIGALAGLGGLLRPNGVALALALALALLLDKRLRAALACLLAGLAPALAFYAWNFFRAGLPTTYIAELAAPYQGGGSGLGSLALLVGGNAVFYARELFARALFYWPDIPGRDLLGWAATGLGLAAVLTGLARKGPLGWRGPMGLHLLVYGAILLIWFKPSPRYLLPVLPFAAAALFQGLEDWESGLRLRRAWLTAATFALGTLLSLGVDRLYLRSALFESNSVNTPPLRTFLWLRQSTRPEDLLAAQSNAQVFLYTGRRALGLPQTGAAPGLAEWCRELGVRYILAAPTDMVMTPVTPGQGRRPLPLDELLRLLSDRGDFEPVFREPVERMAVYRVADRPREKGS